MPATRGVGATMEGPAELGVGNLAIEGAIETSGLWDGRGLGPERSTSTDWSLPLSTATVAGSKGPSVDVTPGRSSYRTGENFTATLAFLCPGRRAIGGRAKFARE